MNLSGLRYGRNIRVALFIINLTFQLNKQLAVDRESGKKHQETANEKLIRKFWENPFIPIGAVVTTGFLVNGLFR